EVRHGFESVAGESCKRAAEANHDQQAPARINQHAFAGPDDEEAHDQAAGDIDDECAVRKHRAKKLGGVTANDPAGIGADNCANGDDHKVAHDGVLLFRVGVISLASAGRLWRTPSPPSFLPQRAQGSTEDQIASFGEIDLLRTMPDRLLSCRVVFAYRLCCLDV